MDRPGFFFCLCPDSLLLLEYVKGILLPSLKTENFEIRTFWADEELEQRFWDSLTLLGMESKLRVLLIRNAHMLPNETWKRLSGLLGTPREQVFPIICMECPWEKGKPKLGAVLSKLKCLAFAEKKKWIWKNQGLDPRTLKGRIQEEARTMGLSLDVPALNKLSTMLMPDASAVHNVLEQLFLATKNGRVDIKLVEQMADFSPEAVVFDFIRQMEAGSASNVWASLLREGDGGESLLFPLLTLMAREARTLWQLRQGEPVAIPPFVQDEKRRLAERLGLEKIGQIFIYLQTAERSVKSGDCSPLQALEMLVSELTLLFRVGVAK